LGQLESDRGCGGLGPQGSRPAARRSGWSGPDGEEFAPDTSASARIHYRAELLTIRVSGSLRRNELGAIASAKNDCNFPWRRQPRRMPRTRQRQERRKHPDQRTSKTGGVHLALSVRTNPEENCFPLTYSFRNGPTRRGALSNGMAAGACYECRDLYKRAWLFRRRATARSRSPRGGSDEVELAHLPQRTPSG